MPAVRRKPIAVANMPDPASLAPWQRQPGESQVVYRQFLAYRDLPRRSLQQVADKLGLSLANIEEHSAQFQWLVRCAAWDNEQQKVLLETRKREQREALARHLEEARALQGLAVRLITATKQAAKDAEKANEPWRPDPLILEKAAKVLKEGVAMERLALGMPSDITQRDIHLHESVQKTLSLQEDFLAILEQELCGECRQRIADRLGQLAERRSAIETAFSPHGAAA